MYKITAFFSNSQTIRWIFVMIIRDTPLADRETVYIINNVRAYAWERSVAGREEGDEVRVHLSEEFVRGHAAQSGYFGVMVGDGEGNIVVRFQQ